MKASILGPNEIFVLLLILIVLAIAIYITVGLPSSADRGISALDQRKLDSQKAEQLKDMEGYYNSFMKTDGGLDSYEASVLVAKAVEYTWRDCSGFCREAGDIPELTRFFADHPIIISRQLDCDKEYEYEDGEAYQISKSRIRGMCSDADLFGEDSPSETKTKRLDEWTVTAWGLKNGLCKNFKTEGKQWGNAYCKGDEYGLLSYDLKQQCISFCATAGLQDWSHEITSDRIKEWKGIMRFGKSYDNIKVTYDPDCTYVIGKITSVPLVGGALEWLYGLKQACSMVEIGGETDMTPTSITDFSAVPRDSEGRTNPEKGKAAVFTGFLKDGDGKALAGKEVKLLGYDGGDNYLGAIKSDATDEYGMFYISIAITECSPFKARAKFEGEGMHSESISSAITVSPLGGGC